MQQITIINEQPLQVKEWQGQRVVTFKDIDALHQRPDGTAHRNFKRNRVHFLRGEDFFEVRADEIRMHKSANQKDEFRPFDVPNRGMILLTESGYLMLVKSFKDDLAWVVQRALVNSYFKGKMNPPSKGFLEMYGVVRPALPNATPQEVAAIFLQAIGAALERGEYYLRPIRRPDIIGRGELLGYYTDEYITIKSSAACAIYASATGIPNNTMSVGHKLWPMLIAAGLGCEPFKHRIISEDGRFRLRRINLVAANALLRAGTRNRIALLDQTVIY